MLRPSHLIASVLGAGLLACGFAGAASARTFPRTTTGIAVFNDQLATGSMTEAQFRFAATHYAGAQKVTRDAVRHLREYNPDFLLLHYRLGQALGHSSPTASCEPTHNYMTIVAANRWVQEWPGDDVVSDAWFFHFADARVFSCAYGHYLMELNDPGWRAWWSAQVVQQMEAEEADGLFADSYSIPNYFGHCAYRPCLPDVDPAFESAWAERERAFTDYMRAQFAGRWKWIPNVGAFITTRDPSDYSNVDGVMIEGFAEWGHGAYLAPDDWALQMNRCLALISADKIVIGQTYPDADDVAERLFVLGTYLLVKANHTYINLDIGLAPEWFPEYAIDLGAPLDPVPQTVAAFSDPAWQVYARRYAKGLVLVNPAPTSHAVDLGRRYYTVEPSGGGIVPADGRAPGSLQYSAVTSVTLAGHHAQILLSEGP
jgi:hypothetical protein